MNERFNGVAFGCTTPAKITPAVYFSLVKKSEIPTGSEFKLIYVFKISVTRRWTRLSASPMDSQYNLRMYMVKKILKENGRALGQSL